LKLDGNFDYLNLSIHDELKEINIYGGSNGNVTNMFWANAHNISKFNMVSSALGGVTYISFGNSGRPGKIISRTYAFNGTEYTARSFYSNSVFSNDTWVHVALTIDGTSEEAKIYINGNLDAVQQKTRLIKGPYPPSNIGIFMSEAVTCFNGSIDDFRIYNRTLSATEIKKVYDAKRSN
jgi:hypothetical protein